jgi:hypothetical protein
MGWCTTADLDRFAAAAGGYLRSTAVENTLLLSAVQAARSGWDPRIVGRPPGTARHQGAGTAPDAVTAQPGVGLLFGWWEPPDGSGPRGAFFHDPAAPLLIAGRAPEMAAALAGTLAKMGRPVRGVDGPIEAADAFAAAWSNRAGASIRMDKQCRVYRLGAEGTGAEGTGAAGAGGAFPADHASPAAAGQVAGGPGSWGPPESPGPVGRLRVATVEDRALIVDWLAAFALEAGERIGSPQEMADDLIGYGGAVLWESPQRTSRIREAAQHLVGSHHRDAASRDASGGDPEPVYQPVAMAALTRPAAGTVRISVVYTLPERRRNGYAAAVTFAASRAVLEGIAPRAVPGTASHVRPQVVMITDTSRSDRRAVRLGYQLIGERAVLRFGPPTGPLPGLRGTGPMPRLPTGPLPRFRR